MRKQFVKWFHIKEDIQTKTDSYCSNDCTILMRSKLVFRGHYFMYNRKWQNSIDQKQKEDVKLIQ